MSHLFSPFTLKGVTLRNRITMSPMTMYRSVDGKLDGYHVSYLGARAAGGFGLVFPEQIAITPEGRTTVSCAGIYDESQLEGLERVCSIIKSMGASPRSSWATPAARAAWSRRGRGGRHPRRGELEPRQARERRRGGQGGDARHRHARRPALTNPHRPVWAARELGYDNPFGLVPDDWGHWLRNFRGTRTRSDSRPSSRPWRAPRSPTRHPRQASAWTTSGWTPRRRTIRCRSSRAPDDRRAPGTLPHQLWRARGRRATCRCRCRTTASATRCSSLRHHEGASPAALVRASTVDNSARSAGLGRLWQRGRPWSETEQASPPPVDPETTRSPPGRSVAVTSHHVDLSRTRCRRRRDRPG